MNINRYLRWGIFVGIFTIPFIPLLVNGLFFFPFITFKNFTFRIIVELILGAWVILALRDRSYWPRFSWILVAIGSFVAIMTVADIFGVNPARSFWSNFERMEGLVTHLHLFAYFLVASSMLTSERLWQRFLQTSVGVSLIVCAYSVLQLSGMIPINQGGVRVDATFGNATYLAIYLLFHIFITAFLILRNRDRAWLNWVYRAVIVLQSVILYYTATRGAILGLIGGVMLTTLLILLFEKDRQKFRKIALYVLIGLVVFAGLFFALRKTSFIQNSQVMSRFASLSVLDEIKTRTVIWGMGYAGFKEHPILGWGQENFNLVFNTHYNPVLYNKEQWFDRTHDIILDWLVAGGIFGLLGYLSIFGALIFCLWKKDKSLTFTERSLFTGLFAGYFFHNIFVFDNITSYIVFFSLLAYFHHLAVADAPVLQNKQDGEWGMKQRVLIPLVVILTVSSLYFINAKPILAGLTLIDALRPQSGGFMVNLDYFKKALAYNTFGSAEIREQLATTAARVNSAPATSIDLATKQSYFDTTFAELKQQLVETPNDARYQLFMASFLDAFGKYSDGIPYLVRALELSPDKQGILTELGSAYINLHDYPRALMALKRAYEVEPSYADARIVYAVGAIYAGQSELARELLVPVYGSVVFSDDRLIRVYYDTKQFDKVVQIWQMRVKAQPANPQYRLSLAASYLSSGQRANAITQLEEIIKMNPDFKKQGEYYISEIKAGRNP